EPSNMKIAAMPPQVGFQATKKLPDPNEPPPPPRNNASTVTQKIVDATVDKTLAGTDRVVGTLAGMTTATVGYISKLPSLAAHSVQSAYNLFESEVIGPNIKVIAGLATPLIVAAGVVGAGFGLVISALTGAVRGFQAHESDKPRDFTIGKAVDTTWTKVRKSVGDFSNDMVSGSAEVRARKLAEGEDPWDIPLPPFGRTAKTMAATVAGLAIGGAGGVATALATTANQAWSGLKQANLAGLATVVASPVTGALHGASKVFTTPVAAAAVAWKQKSLGGALKAAGQECFDTQAGKFSSAAGAFVGGAVAAVPSAATAVVTTTFGDLGKGLKTAATDSELGLGGKGLTALGSVVGAPVAGLVHGAATAISTPFSSLASAWNQQSLSQGLAQGVPAGRSATRPVASTLGAFAGGLAVGTVSALSATGAGLVSEVGGGLVDAATNKELNLSGKLLAGVGGIPGDIITAVGQGLGTLVVTPFKSAGGAIEGQSTSAGVKSGAEYGAGAVAAAASPEKTLLEP
ncbi:MAG: hypothetical protein U0931_31880, partial [Vulcanimicrobiota bacterium]